MPRVLHGHLADKNELRLTTLEGTWLRRRGTARWQMFYYRSVQPTQRTRQHRERERESSPTRFMCSPCSTSTSPACARESPAVYVRERERESSPTRFMCSPCSMKMPSKVRLRLRRNRELCPGTTEPGIGSCVLRPQNPESGVVSCAHRTRGLWSCVLRPQNPELGGKKQPRWQSPREESEKVLF